MDKFSSHPFEPFVFPRSEIIIFGSFPSPKSRSDGFYYGNKQNRFWKILASIYQVEVPADISSKKAFLMRNKIALYDVYEGLTIEGASDSSIKEAKVVDFTSLLKNTNIKRIYGNGKVAYNALKERYHGDLPVYYLPSSSPANCRFKEETIKAQWESVLKGQKIA